MKILICGHNQSAAFENFKGISCKHRIVPHDTQPTVISSLNFNSKMIQFAHVSKQALIPGCINIYQQTPWSLFHGWYFGCNEEERTVLSTYYNCIGWKPDVVIYLYSTRNPDPALDACMDIDNPDDVKIFKLNGDECKLHENLMLILDTVLTHYPKHYLV